jgi:hypothetical protein
MARGPRKGNIFLGRQPLPRPKTAAISALLASLALVLFGIPASYAGDSTGFRWGSDGNGPVPGSGASPCPSSSTPWLEPNVSNGGCGKYGIYVGEVGTFTDVSGVTGCSLPAYWRSGASDDALDNYNNQQGSGAAGYFFGSGPGMDPNFDGTAAEATSWGHKQAEKALSEVADHGNVATSDQYLIFDMEEGDVAGSFGWEAEIVPGDCYTVKSASACCSTALNRDVFNGFRNYVWNNSLYFPGVYSSHSAWSAAMGTGSDATITNTSEWTADWGGNCKQPAPLGWNQSAGSCSSNSPTFFGTVGIGDPCAYLWQWAGGTSDYDQIDSNRTYSCE